MSALVILTDAHHMPGQPETWKRFETLLSDLPQVTHLISLGDFFDIWYRPLKDHRADYDGLLNMIREASKRQIRFTFLSGNRDFMQTSGDLKPFGVQLEEEPLRLTQGPQQLCLMHGDLLLTDDIQYLDYRKKIRTPMARFMTRHFPRFIVDPVLGKLRETSQQEKAVKPLDQYKVNLDEANRFLGSHSNLLVAGHTHIPLEAELPNGSLRILPAFGDTGEYLVIDENGAISLNKVVL